MKLSAVKSITCTTVRDRHEDVSERKGGRDLANAESFNLEEMMHKVGFRLTVSAAGSHRP